MAILRNDTTVRSADGQSTSSIITAANIGNYGISTTSTYYIGTTQNVFNRASGAQTLTGVSIDGNAATVTNGVYTTGAQTIGGTKTFSDGVVVNGATYYTFNKPTTTNYQTVALFGSASGGLFLTTDSAIIGVGAYYNAGWIATATSGRHIDFAGGTFNFNVFSGATVGGTANWGSVATLNSSGTFSATGDFRAPVFYDSNNTAYYIDPASTSVLNKINLNSAGVAAIQWRAAGVGTIASGYPFYNNASYGSINIEVSDNDTGGLVIDNEGVTVYGAADNGQLFRTIDEDVYQTNGNNVANATTFWINQGADGGGVIRGTFSATADFRAPIFYDSANTAYYIDPASTSVLYSIAAGVAGNSSANIPALKVTSSGVATTQAAIAIQQQYAEGDTVIFCDYAQYVEWNLMHENASNQLIIHGGASTGNLGSNTFYSPDGTAKTGYIKHVFDMTDGNAYIGGKVGIGTTTPGAKLEIYNGDLWLNAAGSSINPEIRFIDDSGISVAGAKIRYNNTDGNIYFEHVYNNASSGIFFRNRTAGTALETLTLVNGNVGIGATGPDTNLQVVGHVHVGNQTTFENTGGWNKTIYLDGTIHARMRILGSAYASGKNSATETSIWVDNSVAPYSGLTTNAGSFTINAGFTTLTNSARSPIFYDSDDTNYYSDPAGLNRFNALNIGNQGALTGNTTYALGAYHNSRYMVGLRYSSGGAAYPWLVHDSWNGSAFIIHFNGVGDRFHVSESGIAYVTGDFRAPIFYDSNNTAYYLDPASTSNLNTVTVNDVLTYGVVAAKSFSVSVNTSTYWTVVRPNGSSIATGYVYRITLCTTGTGTDTGEQYLLANVDSAGWVIKTVTKTGSGSNWPYVFLDAGVPKVKTDHASLYTVTVLVEELNSGNTGGLPSVFGLAGLFTSDNGTPKYRAGWFSSDNTLLHSGNYGGYSTFSGIVSSAVGGFQTATYAAGRNRIWSFGNSDGYGLSYFQGSGGISGSDVIGLHFGTATAVGSQFQFLGNGSFRASGDIRAPIFYDSDNTAYYCDPASTSVLNALTVGGNSVLTTASTLTAGNLSGTIPSGVLGNSTLYVGTTAIALNRASASQSLTGVNIDGNAGGSSTFVASLGSGLNYDIDRTTKKSGLSHYSGYSSGTNRPTTYDYTLQVTDGGKGWEISMDWIATTGPAIYARSLRDCCQNWSSWVRVLDSVNYSYAYNMNQNVRTTDNVTFANVTGAIFYDAANTAYYIDAASTSNLVGLTVANTITGSVSGNAGTATILQTARNINGTSFNGSAAITTATWGTARTITIGSTGKSVDGSAAVSWSLGEIGALPLAGGTMTGDLRFNQGTGFGRIAYADNYHGMILRGIPSDALGNVTVGDYTSLIQHSGDFRFYRTNGSVNELYFQVNATAPYWRGNIIIHAANYSTYSAFTSSLTSTVDVRGPIFYDSNDTTYYTDPASFSLISSLGIGGLTSSNNVQMYDSYVDASSSYLQSPPLIIRKDSSATGAIDQAPVGLFIYNLNGTNNTWTKLSMGSREATGAGNTVSIAGLAAQKTAGTANAWATGNLHFWTKASNTQITNMVAYSAGYVQSDYSFRSPIFYDSNDTTYYIDAASTSQLNQVASYYLRNLAGVSTDHQFGLFFNNSIDTAYAIYREGGAWTNPYPDLRIAFHTGIKLGANAGYNGIRFYNDYTMATQVMSVNNSSDGLGADNVYVNNSLQAGSSLRSPIYYDSDNTGYYINAAGSSVVNSITSNDDYTNGWFRSNVSGYGIYNQITGEHFYSDASDMWNIASANGTQGLRFRTGGYNGTIRGYVYVNDSNDVGLLNNGGNWRIRVVGGDYVLFDGSSARAQIFYDSNDTAYYVNPASNSVLNGLFANSYNNLVNDFKDIYVYGDVNTYYVVLIQPEYQYSFGRYSVTRGYNWAGPDTWNTATHKGGLTLDIEWSGDTAWGGNDKAVRVIEFNETYSTMVGGLALPVTGGLIVWLRGGGVNGAQYRIRTPIGSNLTVTAYDGVSATNHSTSTSFTAGDSTVYSTRANTSNVNSEVYGRYPVRGAALVYNENNLVVDTGGNTQTKSGIFASAASVRAPIFYDTDNTGYYVDPNSTSNLVGLTVANTITGSVSGNAATATLATKATRANGNFYIDDNYGNTVVGVYSASRFQGVFAMGDSYKLSIDGSTTGTLYGIAWSHPNAGGVAANLNTHGALIMENGTFLAALSGSIRSRDDMRSPIFYDSNNTSYYVDPASTSNLVGLTVANTITGSITGNAGGSSASCTGNAATATRTSGQSGYPHAGTGMFAFYNWGGSDGGTSAPSASTYTTGLSVGSNPGDQAYGFQIANNMWNTGLWTRNYNSGFGSWIRLLDSSNYVGYSAFTGNVDGTQFRDANNTAYYIDPASTSNLVGLTVANTITGAVSGNAGSVTINYNNDSNSTYQMLWGSGNNVYGTAGVYLNPSTDYVTATSFNASDWFRSSGATGWYNSTYGGGIYMTDTTWVRTYNSKYFYCDTIIQAGSDMRSPVYYDSNDTTYYVDAASTSNLLLVKTRNTFGERVAVSATASTTINTQYNVTELTLAATITTLTLSNIQASGTVHMWTIVTVGGGVGYSITWPAAVKWPGGTAPTLTTTSNKRDIYQFVTYDGGTTIFAIIVGQNL